MVRDFKIYLTWLNDDMAGEAYIKLMNIPIKRIDQGIYIQEYVQLMQNSNQQLCLMNINFKYINFKQLRRLPELRRSNQIVINYKLVLVLCTKKGI